MSFPPHIERAACAAALPLDGFGYLWTGTETFPGEALEFLFGLGGQYNTQKESIGGLVQEFQALAVRNGDVLTTVTPPNDVPEPGTLLLTAAALLGLGVARRGRSGYPSRA